jgi:hypothetical protein
MHGVGGLRLEVKQGGLSRWAFQIVQTVERKKKKCGCYRNVKSCYTGVRNCGGFESIFTLHRVKGKRGCTESGFRKVPTG